MKFIAGCVKCCTICLEKIVKFLNNHAYVETILKGTNFCTSARAAVILVAKNTLRFAVLHGLGTIVMLFAKLFITAITLLAAYLTLTKGYQIGDGQNGIYDIIAPLFVKIFSNIFSSL